MSHILLDYETYYDDECSVVVQGNEMYARHPLCDPYLLAACDGENTWVGHPRDFDYNILDNYDEVVAYNSGFDYAIATIACKLKGYGSPDPARMWNCASDMGSYCLGTTHLNLTVKKAFGVTLNKAIRTGAKGKTWEQMRNKEAVTEYARRDGYWGWRLFEDYHRRWPAVEQRIAQLTRRESRHGVAIDVDLLHKYLEAAQTELHDIESKLPWVQELDEKPTSSKAIATQCRKSGIPCPPTKKADEEGFAYWEETYSPKHEWVKKVGQWRSVNKVVTTLKTIKARLRDDNTIESPLRYFGATSTGRWSGESGLNFQNLRKDPIVCAGVEIHMRKLIVPRTGKKMWVADLAQIEPRVLNWFVNNQKMLDEIAKGISPYEVFARQFLSWNGGPLKNEDPHLYKLAKAMVLGAGYGAGGPRFKSVAKTLAGIDLTEEESQEAVDTFRAKRPDLAGEDGMWNVLDREFKKAARNSEPFEFELPSGRLLRYEDIRMGFKTYTEKKDIRVKVNGEWQLQSKNVPVKKRVFLTQVNNRVKNVYGALITENATQACARDVFAECFLSLLDGGVRVPFSVHDEAVIEAEPDVTEADIRDMMEGDVEWMPGLPVEAEIQEVPHYTK